MTTSPKKPKRLQPVISMKMHAYLELLASKGPYGNDANDVVRFFIQTGILQAKKDKFLSDQEINEIGKL